MAPEDGLKRGIAIWHRRGGKDSTALNLTCFKAHQRIGTYWHLLPSQRQAKRVVWNETDSRGRRIIDQAFPHDIRESTSELELSIRFTNGSLWQLGGSDNYDSLVGSNVRGVVFSEWALCNPAAWDYIRPILLENDGWALFIYTPRGRNHGWELWERVRNNSRWFAELLTRHDTFRDDGVTPIFTDDMIEQEREDGMSEEMIEQEYECSFAAGVVGAYFARYLEKARKEGRIGSVPWSRRYPVHLYFDLGIDDCTAVWFGQRVGWQRRWFKYLEWKDVALQDIFDEVAEMPYRYGTVNLPHDGKQRDKGTGRKIQEYADDAFEGQRAAIYVHEAYNVQDSIEAGRALISQSWFDEVNCKHGLSALLNYQKVWDEKKKAYQQNPMHNWASHGADAWRLAGMDDVDEPVHDMGEGPDKPHVHRQTHGSISVGVRQ